MKQKSLIKGLVPMGVMRFRVLPTERITETMAQQAYLSGLDRTAWRLQAGVQGGELLLGRSVDDSGNAHLPWTVETVGSLTLTTGTLTERQDPYLLPLEIARGTIVQVRNQLAEWTAMGLQVPAEINDRLVEAVRQLSWAAVSQDDLPVCADRADAALRLALEAADALAGVYADQALAIRRHNARFSCCLAPDLGASLPDHHTARQIAKAFNAAGVPMRWRDVETTEGTFSWTATDKQIDWCRKHGLKVVAGPLLMLDPHDLPHWFYLFEDDFDSALEFSASFVRAAVERYRGKVDYWICAGRVNASDAVALSEQERVALVARTVELVRTLDPHTPALVSFDQPWAEYLRDRDSDFPPLAFADTLIRSGVGVGGLVLELNVGYWPGGSLRRQPLEFSRLLDVWSLLGPPLWLALTVPSSAESDPLAQHKEAVPSPEWNPEAQQGWVSRHVPLALAKPTVHGILWNQLRDSQPHDFPNGGLIDAQGRWKPAIRALAAFRHANLE